jgi:hypothetical protein
MDLNISKMKNHPLNRDGETITIQAEEGDLVGLTENNDGETEIVGADADSANAQPAMGVLMESIQDPSAITVDGYEDDYIEQRQLRREVREREGYTLVGDEATYVTGGIFVEDVDETLDLTPNEPVYLAVGGGVTQSKPDGTTGNVIQYLGVAVDATSFYLDVDHEYETAA